VTQSPLVSARAGLWDRGAALQVRLVSGALESRPVEAVVNGAHLVAIGDGSSGNWELFQFANADPIGPQTWLISNRLRGQLGSDGLMPDVWPEGSWVVLLDSTPEQIDLTSAQRRMARHFRIGPAGRGYDDPSYVHLVEAFDGNGLRPYAPCHLRAERAAGGDVALGWRRRTRIDGDDWSLADVPLGEDNESYVLRVMQGVAVLRETTVTTPGWTYSAAMQATDGVGAGGRIEVAQVSARFGPGLRASLPIPA
jgi:hypothetical protein